MKKKQLYSKEQVVELTGAGESTVQAWSQRLRNYNNMVIKPRKMLYTDEFVRFLKTRPGQLGVSPMLPSPEKIAELYFLHKKYDGDVTAIATELGEPIEIVKMKLEEVGLL